MVELDFGRLVLFALIRNFIKRNSGRLDNFLLLRNIFNMVHLDFGRLNKVYYVVTW